MSPFVVAVLFSMVVARLRRFALSVTWPGKSKNKRFPSGYSGSGIPGERDRTFQWSVADESGLS